MQVFKLILSRKIEKPMALGCIGFFVGILLMNLGKGLWLEGELFDVDTMYYMKYMTVDKSAYLGFVMWERLKIVLLAVILATTYLGLIACRGMVVWYGASFGAFLTVLSARYGFKGILFGLLSVFPHFVLYVPAMVALLLLCEEVFRSIYYRQGEFDWKNKKSVLQKATRLIGIVIAIIIGCLLEVYVNTPMVLGILKIF